MPTVKEIDKVDHVFVMCLPAFQSQAGHFESND